MVTLNIDLDIPDNYADCKQLTKSLQADIKLFATEHLDTRLNELEDRAKTHALEGKIVQQKSVHQI
jgi:hypothetical protein